MDFNRNKLRQTSTYPVWGGKSIKLICAGSEDEGQDALRSDLSSVEDRRFEDPLTRRLHSGVSQREVTTNGRGFNDEPFFRNSNLNIDSPHGVHLFGVRRVDRFDSGNRPALYIALRNHLRFLRQGSVRWRYRRRRLAQVTGRGRNA